MKIRELFDLVDSLKANNYSIIAKLYWLNSLEGKIAADIMLMAPAELQQFRYTEDDMDAELLVETPHEDIYVLWMSAQIELADGDFDKYQNTLILYTEALHEFSIWFADNYNPAGNGPNSPQYFITAYALAVKQGYNGSLDDWLRSLTGKSAYEIAVEHGYTGTEDEWLELYTGAAERAEAAAETAVNNSSSARLAANAATTARDRCEEILTEIDPGTLQVGTENIRDLAVTEGKLAAGAVTENKLGAGAVTEDKLGAGAVTGEKIAAAAVTEDKLGGGAVTGEKIAAGAVTGEKIAAGSVSKEYRSQLSYSGWANEGGLYTQSVSIAGLQAESRVSIDIDCSGKSGAALLSINEAWGAVLKAETYLNGVKVTMAERPGTEIPIKLLEVLK